MDSSLRIKINLEQRSHNNNKLLNDDDIDHDQARSISLGDLDLFFQNALYNSCRATDELIRSIEQSQNETLARRALDLYQRHYLSLERPWDHVTFMYGLGLIYMHFNAYNWAVKSFREAIYVQPSFPRSRDVHTRLGLIFKATARYKLSEKHFRLAINDTRPDSGTSTKSELNFHLAHLYEIQGKLKQASEAYEKLLQENNLPPKLSANIQRQLGWINYSIGSQDSSSAIATTNSNINHYPHHGPKSRKDNMFNQQTLSDPRKMDAALNYLNTSYKIVNDSGTSYYLGRCLTNLGKFQDAFASYRSVLDKEESTADTWCSIGVLYHRQNQPLDALQAYIRAVQFDKMHEVAWMNLGVLYEGHNQFRDALKCYQHVMRARPSGASDRSLQLRIKYIQRHLTEIEASSSNNGKLKANSDKLLSLEDLWNLGSKSSTPDDSKPSNSGGCNSTSQTTKTPQGTSIISRSVTTPPRDQTNNQQQPITGGAEPISTSTDTSTIHQEHQQSNGQIDANCNSAQSIGTTTTTGNCKNASEANPTSMSMKEDSSSKLSSNLIHPDSKSSDLNGLPSNCKPDTISQGSQGIKPRTFDHKDFCPNQAFSNGASKDSGISSNSSTDAECALVPSHNTNINSHAPSYISAEQVIEACRNSPKPRKIDVNLLDDDTKPPCYFPRHPPYPPHPSDKLFPSPPSIFLESKKDLTSKKLQEFCQSGPISIVRNIATILKLDLGLFSTKSLVESNPDQQIDITSHQSNHRTEANGTASNADDDTTNHWSCERQRSHSTISHYANYQVGSFRESLQEERDSKTSSKSNPTKELETDSSGSAPKKSNNVAHSSSAMSNHDSGQKNQGSNSKPGSATKKLKKEQPKSKFVRSAEGIDISDEKKWRPQLNELNKLPYFIRCVSASNMLTHIGESLPGINTVVMSMHVPGCRVVGNRTPNNFCPININTGPGDYEWCAISGEYERVLTRLCNRNGFEIDEMNWWPKMNDLLKYNIPIYRFTQRPGDLVWVNSGTFYWVQATGWTNSIKWNVGPLSARQYKLASESFEINKLLFRKSDVPMVQMTWNIVININVIVDDELFRSFTDVLQRSLRYCSLIKDLVQHCSREIKIADHEPGPRRPKFCCLCGIEIFNITFTRREDHSIQCVECARRSDATLRDFDIDQEYDLDYLAKLYDNFIDTKKKLRATQQVAC